MRQPLLACLTACLIATVLGACGRPNTASADGAASGVASGAASGNASTAKAGNGKNAAPAAVLLLSPEDLRTVQASAVANGPVISGSVQPERRADLRAEVAAVVLQVYKENGELVRQGDLLMRLDDTSIRDSLNAAEEATRAATQTFEQSERQVQRLKTLQTQGMMSMQALEDAELRRNNAQSDLVAAKTRGVTARQQLRRTEVRAPFAGVVSERKASTGDTTQIGKELVKVIDPSSMRFEGLVSAAQLYQLKVGEPVSFRVNGYAQGDFKGKVQRIDASANATTRQVAVIVSFNDQAAAPKVAGLFAEGRIEAGSSQALLLPESSLVRAGEQASVWRLQGKTLNKVAVKTGERDPRTGDVPITEGLSAGDRVLRNPGSSLVNGQTVEFAPTPGATAASGAQTSVATTAAT